MVDLTKDIHGLSLTINEAHALDLGSKDKKEKKLLDYTFSAKDNALAFSTSKVAQFDIQVWMPIDYDDNDNSGNDKVFCQNTNS